MSNFYKINLNKPDFNESLYGIQNSIPDLSFDANYMTITKVKAVDNLENHIYLPTDEFVTHVELETMGEISSVIIEHPNAGKVIVAMNITSLFRILNNTGIKNGKTIEPVMVKLYRAGGKFAAEVVKTTDNQTTNVW